MFIVLYTLLIIWMQQKTFICYLYVCEIGVCYYFHVCSIKFYFFGSFSLKLAYFAVPNWFGWNFSIIFNYQRCLENSKILTYIIFLVFLFIITRFSLIYLPSFPDCMIISNPLPCLVKMFFFSYLLLIKQGMFPSIFYKYKEQDFFVHNIIIFQIMKLGGGGGGGGNFLWFFLALLFSLHFFFSEIIKTSSKLN